MASKIVVDAVKARIASGFTSCPVYYPNEETKPTADLSEFVVVEFPIGSGQPLTIDGTDRETGTVRFVVHVALKGGTDTALTYADALAALFRQAKLTSGPDVIRMGSPSSPVPIGDRGAFYTVSTSTPFTRFL